MPAASRSTTSSRTHNAIWKAVSRARLIVAHERPLQDRDRAGEHPLHRPRGERLGVLAPANGHRPRARNVAEEDRRLDAQRAVALHPAVGRPGEAFQLLAEVLDHVGPLELAVHQHVQPDLFLKADGPLDFLFAERFVAFEPTTRPSSNAARALRTSPVCGKEPMVVVGNSGRERRRRWASRRSASGLRRRSMSSLTPATRCRTAGLWSRGRRGAAFDGRPACRQFVGHGRPAAIQRLRQNRDLVQLLLGEGHPALQFGVERGLVVEIDRAMQQRTGRGHHDAVGAELGRRFFQQVERLFEVAAPHVAAVDHAQRERHARRRGFQRAVQLLGRRDQIEMHGRHRHLQRGRQIVAEVAEIGRQANPNLIRRRAQPCARRFERVQRFLGQIERQHRLVDLHPIGPGVGQLPKHFFIDRQDLVEQAQRLRLRRLALAQQQERQRPEQHGPRVDAQRGGFAKIDRPAWSRRA